MAMLDIFGRIKPIDRHSFIKFDLTGVLISLKNLKKDE